MKVLDHRGQPAWVNPRYVVAVQTSVLDSSSDLFVISTVGGPGVLVLRLEAERVIAELEDHPGVDPGDPS